MTTIRDLEGLNRQHGYHFFDRDSLRFFDSKIYPDVFPAPDGSGWFFVTSEQFHNYARGDHGPRLYTVREMFPDGRVQTVGEFQQYDSKDAAFAAATEEVCE